MLFGVAIVVLLAINAIATILATYRLGIFNGLINAVRSDTSREMETFRQRADHMVNHMMGLGEKVDQMRATQNEANRLQRGPPAGRGSRPDT